MAFRTTWHRCALAALALIGFNLPVRADAADMQTSYFMVLGKPVEGQESEFVTWYSGQHIHDLLNIPGVVAAQFFKLSDPQYRAGQPHPYQYMVIWEVRSDDLPGVFQRIQNGLAAGTTVRSAAMASDSINNTFSPVTKRLTAEDVRGKSVAEVLQMSGGK